MTRLRGHFNGQMIVLEQPPPPELTPDTPVEVIILSTKEQVLRDWTASVKTLWARPLPSGFKPEGRSWKREELYERGGKPLA